MATVFDRVSDLSTTTGTGSFTLAVTPPSTYFSFANVPLNTLFDYCIAHKTLNEMEVGSGYLSSSTVLVRNQVDRSSNADALVNFSAGDKEVFITVGSRSVQATTMGSDLAIQSKQYQG